MDLTMAIPGSKVAEIRLKSVDLAIVLARPRPKVIFETTLSVRSDY